MLHYVIWILFRWPDGIVLGNLIASVMWALPAWFLLLHKLHCGKPCCFRPAKHPVAGTTYHTCQKHTTRDVHDKLFAKHEKKFPDQHDLLNGGSV